MVPGCLYLDFLTSILTFLALHPSEIVVVELKDDGFVVKADRINAEGVTTVLSMVPTEDELEKVWEEAREKVKETTRGTQEVVRGGAKDLDRNIGELIEEGKRLILIDRIHRPEEWQRDDSYGTLPLASSNPTSLLSRLIPV